MDFSPFGEEYGLRNFGVGGNGLKVGGVIADGVAPVDDGGVNGVVGGVVAEGVVPVDGGGVKGAGVLAAGVAPVEGVGVNAGDALSLQRLGEGAARCEEVDSISSWGS